MEKAKVDIVDLLNQINDGRATYAKSRSFFGRKQKKQLRRNVNALINQYNSIVKFKAINDCV